ncbi:hypothetical protein ACGF0J_30925 [Nonomuraea sp. NPDC047897]|uniref:hypothetical protein n=1 Tax=Nonomuraea sp. NPDC047897 TaxID=3364346 RepID=UPI0037188B4A
MLLGIEISIIALAPVASAAAPMTPDGGLRLAPRIITRTYHLATAAQVSHRYVPLHPRVPLDRHVARHRHLAPHQHVHWHVHQHSDWHGDQRADRRTDRHGHWRRDGRQHRAAGKRADTTPATARRALPPLDLARVEHRHATVRMSHAHAATYLLGAGLRYRSTGRCTDRHVPTCTSLDAVRTGTIARIIALKHASDCPIMVTGGTEVGHAPGRFSHGQGYKLDISHNACIDRYIAQHSEPDGVRGDGARLYRAPSGTIYADESDHWDIMFK